MNTNRSGGDREIRYWYIRNLKEVNALYHLFKKINSCIFENIHFILLKSFIYVELNGCIFFF